MGTNLVIGDVDAAENIDTFTATSATNVELHEEINGVENGVDYTVTTGEGDDELDIELDGDAVDTIGESFALDAGNGENTVTVDMQGAGVSVATTEDLNNLSITTGSDKDSVTLIGGSSTVATSTIEITAGATTADTVTYTVDGVAITANVTVATAATNAQEIVDAINAAIDAATSASNPELIGLTAEVDGDSVVIAFTDNAAHTVTPAAGSTGATFGANSAGVIAAADDGDADFTITTDAESDFVYINSKDDAATSLDDGTGSWTVGDATVLGNDFPDTVLYKAELTVSFAGFESTIEIDTNAADNFIATQVEINEAIMAAIEDSPELKTLLTTELGTGSQELTIESIVEGLNDLSITVNQPTVVATLNADVSVAAGQVLLNFTADETALLTGLLEVGETITSSADANTIMTAVNDNGSKIIDDITANVDEGSSANEENVINVSTIDLGKGANDLVVLNSHDESSNTLVFSDLDMGKVSVVNYFTELTVTDEYKEEGTLGAHQLDFTAFLDNTEDSSTANTNSLSVDRVATSFSNGAEVDANSVHMFTFSESLNATTTTSDDETWDNLTASDLFAAIKGTNTGNTLDYGNIGESTLDNGTDYTVAGSALVQTSIKSIVMIENDQNLGEYKVFELTASETTNDFTAVNLVGIVDFGASIDNTDFNATDDLV